MFLTVIGCTIFLALYKANIVLILVTNVHGTEHLELNKTQTKTRSCENTKDISQIYPKLFSPTDEQNSKHLCVKHMPTNMLFIYMYHITL